MFTCQIPGIIYVDRGGLVVGLECGLGWVSFGILVVQFLRIFMRVAAKGPLCFELHIQFLCFQAFCFEFWSLTLLDIYCPKSLRSCRKVVSF